MPSEVQARMETVLVFWLASAAAAAAAAVAAAVWAVCSTAKWLWLCPRRLERALRAQGLPGSRHRFPYGDLKDHGELINEARRKPMPLSHGIVPGVVPQFSRTLELYGDKSKLSFYWFGPYPRLIIMDPDLIEDVLSSKFGHFGKLKSSPIGRLLVTGLVNYEDEKWVKRRRIINPVFHVEKLKMMIPAFSACCDELINRWEDLIGSSGKCELNVWQSSKTLPEMSFHGQHLVEATKRDDVYLNYSRSNEMKYTGRLLNY